MSQEPSGKYPDPDSVAGRVAVVVGGTGLLGRSVLARLHQRDAATVAFSRKGGAVAGARLSVAVDVADEQALDEAVRWVETELGPVEILVHAAHPTSTRRARIAELGRVPEMLAATR